MRRRHTWFAALAAGLTLTAAACSQTPEPTFLGKNRINIGFKSDQPGTGAALEYHPTGFDYQVGSRITQELGVDMAERYVPSDDRVPSLTKTKKNDLVIATFSITKERMDEVDFVGPYLVNRQGLLVNRSSGVKGLSDLRGKLICTYKGTTSAALLHQQKIGIPVEKDTASQCVKAMLDGSETAPVAMSTDQLILYGFAEKYASEGLQVLPDLTFGPPQMYGIAMPKKHRGDCVRLLEIVKDYVGSNDWLEDLSMSLPQVVRNNPNWKTDYLPSEESIMKNSCTEPRHS